MTRTSSDPWEQRRAEARIATAQWADDLIRAGRYAEAFVALTAGDYPLASEQKTAVELLNVLIRAAQKAPAEDA